jgi:hypothetical protein
MFDTLSRFDDNFMGYPVTVAQGSLNLIHFTI